jgi:hypothetical protein
VTEHTGALLLFADREETGKWNNQGLISSLQKKTPSTKESK